MPWTDANPPAVAKHWTPEQKHRCVVAANAVLSEGKGDQEAIFACIHAAGKTKHKQEDEYDSAGEDAALALQGLVERYQNGEIDESELKKLLREAIELNILRMVLIGRKDKALTEQDLLWINAQVEIQYGYLDGYVDDLKTMSKEKALWRIGLYGFMRNAFVYGEIPADVALLMPDLPGSGSCLGGNLCGCFLTIDEDDENYYVYWNLDPVKEHCSVCVSYSMESPFVFPKRE